MSAYNIHLCHLFLLTLLSPLACHSWKQILLIVTRFGPDLQGSTRTEAQGSEHKIEVPDVKKHCCLTGNINSKISLFLHPCWSCTKRKSCQTSWTQSTIRRLADLAFFFFFSINVHISKEFWQPPARTGTIARYEFGFSLHFSSKTQTPGSLCLVRVWAVLYCVLQEPLFDSLKVLRSN